MITYNDFCKAYSAKHILVLNAMIEQVKACSGDEFGYLSDVEKPEEMSEKAFKSYVTILKENGHIEMTGVEDGYRVLVEGCYDEPVAKKEIRLIEELIALDGYFADSFKSEREVIISNIKNDFPLLCSTRWDKAECELSKLNARFRIIESANIEYERLLKKQCNELDELRGQKNEMIDFLIEQAEKWSASDLRQAAIEMIGKKEYLRRKMEKGFNLWELDKEILLEVLRD